MSITVSTFNTLANQCADTSEMGFPLVDYNILSWNYRMNLIVNLINTDICCLQEVDKWDELIVELEKKGYEGKWWNSSDPSQRHGCAIIWKRDRFTLNLFEHHQYTNCTQVMMSVLLIDTYDNNNRVRVTTTHLKSKKAFASIRVKQVEELLEHIYLCDEKYHIVAGDFNSEPTEECIQMMNKNFNVSHLNIERTTIKVRPEHKSEECKQFAKFDYKDGRKYYYDIPFGNTGPSDHITVRKLEKTSHVIDYIYFKGFNQLDSWYKPEGDIDYPYLPCSTHPSDHFMIGSTFSY